MRKAPVVVVDTQDLWIRLPFQALGRLWPTIGLRPHYTWNPFGTDHEFCVDSSDSGFAERSLPLPRRTFGRLGEWFGPLASLQIRRVAGTPHRLVCDFPHQRALPLWFPKSSVFYYAADDFSTDYGYSSETIVEMERRLIGRVHRVFAVSSRLAEVLSERHHYPRERITVVPNGVPESTIPSNPPSSRTNPPSPIPPHFRPLAGVLGSINNRLRMDWVLQAVEALPWLHWAFIGPIKDLGAEQAENVAKLQSHPQCCFTGEQPYQRIPEFAAAFDVAVIPLNDSGINPACSPVRLFSQLPFGQPIIATAGCQQLAEFAPLVQTAHSAAEMIQQLAMLQNLGFKDGLEEKRWKVSRQNTWEKRGEALCAHICN